MKGRLIFILTACCVVSTMVFGQKQTDIHSICGKGTYYAPANVTIEQAKQIALDRARMDAIEKKFGMIVSQQNSTVVTNENGKSSVIFISVGGSEGKAEWIGDSQDPKYDDIKHIKDASGEDMMIVSVSVCGEAREITKAGIDFSTKILRNGTEAKYEDDKFKHKDDFYLMFRSPVNGYLAVYLSDMEKVYCLLPYMNEGSGKRKIKSGKDYVFFSEKHAEPSETNTVTEYILTCEKQIEQNFVYIIFSPNEFTKANDYRAENETVLPRELSYVDFQKWLSNNRKRDKDMEVRIISVTITK
jgi:hypothetical protein